MSKIDREGVFRGKILVHGVSETKNGYPQWSANLLGLEIWDADEKEWVDWSDMEENEIVCYQVLYGGDGKATLSCTQLQAITGWEGLSFGALAGADLTNTGIQFRVEETEYEGKTRLEVTWIDEYDAEPSGGIRKLDANGLRELDAKYKSILKAGKTSATKATKSKPKVTAKGIKSTQGKGPVTKKTKSSATEPPAAEPLAAEPPAAEPPAAEPPTTDIFNFPMKVTKDEAWTTVVQHRRSDVSDEDLAKSWIGSVKNVADSVGTKEADFGEDEWGAVMHSVLDHVS